MAPDRPASVAPPARPRPRSAATLRDWGMHLEIPEAVMPAVLESCLRGVPARVHGTTQNVLLCAMPKSGSLYLTQLLALSLGLANHQIGFAGRGGSVYYPRLLGAKFVGRDTISHCHASADPLTLELIANLALTPLVLTRNVLDALVSRHDMLLRDGWAGCMVAQEAMERFRAADLARRMDVVIDLFAPGYLDFCGGWHARRVAAPDLTFLTYEELVTDETALALRVGESLGRPVDREAVSRASTAIRAEGGINFSTGRPGRGREVLSERQIARVAELAVRLGCDPALLEA